MMKDYTLKKQLIGHYGTLENGIETAYEILKFENKSAKWIAKNALTELQKDNLRMSDYPRIDYRSPITNNGYKT
jgi:hypothetical protein